MQPYTDAMEPAHSTKPVPQLSFCSEPRLRQFRGVKPDRPVGELWMAGGMNCRLASDAVETKNQEQGDTDMTMAQGF